MLININFKDLRIEGANIDTLPVAFAGGFLNISHIVLQGIRSFGKSSLRFPGQNSLNLTIKLDDAVTFAPGSLSCRSRPILNFTSNVILLLYISQTSR
jgi:hypothetical protein